MAKDAAVGAWQCEERQKDLPAARTHANQTMVGKEEQKRDAIWRGVGVFVKFYLAKSSYFPFLPFLLACLEAYSPQPTLAFSLLSFPLLNIISPYFFLLVFFAGMLELPLVRRRSIGIASIQTSLKRIIPILIHASLPRPLDWWTLSSGDAMRQWAVTKSESWKRGRPV